MAWRLSKHDDCGFGAGQSPFEAEINVLASEGGWAWPQALRSIFQPRGINLLMAREAADFVNIIESKRIHTTIINMDEQGLDALNTIKVIRLHFPMLPCILLSGSSGEEVLGRALRLNVFSVIGKPVDMDILQHQLDRIFIKRYDSRIFSQ